MERPETIGEAARGRVEVVAITDHDEIRGALRARDWAHEHPELGVDVVVGDEALAALNTDYRTKRTDDVGMVAPRLVEMPPGSFHRWMREVPRVLRAALVSLCCFLEVPARRSATGSWRVTIGGPR